jgi:hypothetical protein
MQRASANNVFALPPASTRPWTSQVTLALPTKVGEEEITAVPLPPALPHSEPPLSRRVPGGQVTVTSFVSPAATATPALATAVAPCSAAAPTLSGLSSLAPTAPPAISAEPTLSGPILGSG